MKYANIIYKTGDKIGAAFFIKEVGTTLSNRRAIFACKCGKEFEAAICNVKSGAVRSCGCAMLECWIPRKKKRKIILCACGCGTELVGVSEYGRSRKFIHGHNKANLGNSHTEESNENNRLKHLGKVIPLDVRVKMGSKKEKNPNWKGGITPINDLIRKTNPYKIWRKSVFERDNYTCQDCGEKEKVSGKLEADHIKPFAYFPELRFAIDNGRTLCKECHKKTETYLVKAKIKYG